METNEAEVWKDIKGYEGKYQISNNGNVKSLSRSKEKILKPKLDHHNRLVVTFKVNNKITYFQVSSLVYKYFINSDIDTKRNAIMYKDNNSANCNVNNLYIISQKEYRNRKEFLDKIKKKNYRYKGKDYNLTEITALTKINKHTFINRLRNGWSIEEAVEIPVEREDHILHRVLYKYKGELLSIKQIAEKYNLRKENIYKRLRKGWTIEEAIEIPTAKFERKI